MLYYSISILMGKAVIMNPLFVFYVIILAFLIWVLLAFVFNFVGKITNRLSNDVKKAMFEEVEEKEKKEVNE